ncbi:MAG TPA: CRTAC1 family protein [Planctomycetes bacterium]|nr:CRTAC1 family protein [Planctomycetota bacterium]
MSAPSLPVSSFLFLVACAAVSCGKDEPAPRRGPDQRTQVAARPVPKEIDLPPLEGPSPVHFVDGTEEAGIDFVLEAGKSEDFFYVEFMSGGAAFFDADSDGDVDLFLANGKRLKGPPVDPAPTNALYLNDGTGHFTDATEASGLGDPRYSVAACAADYDNDGDTDLYVENFDGDNALWRNNGDGTFTDVAAQAGVTGGGAFGSSCAFADVDGDGLVDLYVAYCNEASVELNKTCSWPRRDGTGNARRYCNPENYRPVPDRLYRNNGDGTFEDISLASGIQSSVGRSLGVAFADYDDDGDQDLFVSCDRTENLYYENDGSGHFTEGALVAGLAVSDDGKRQAGMGIVSGDWSGDGRIDVAVTYFEREWNAFYKNMGHHTFAEWARQNGTASASFLLLAWGIEFFDADLDTNLDCMVVNGHIMDNVTLFREPVAGYEQPNLFYLNRGDALFQSLGTEAGPALGIEKVSRGLLIADIDNDGDVDALVTNLQDRVDLLRNDSPRGGKHFLSVHLVGTKSNRSAIGARVIAHLDGKDLVREVHSGQSYLCQSDLRQHFGLGEADVVPDLEIRWPSGIVTHLENVAADQFLEVVEGE